MVNATLTDDFLPLSHQRYQHTLDEVENLLKKHEAFEKSAAAQEERFAALERLTTVSWAFFFAPSSSSFCSALRERRGVPTVRFDNVFDRPRVAIVPSVSNSGL